MENLPNRRTPGILLGTSSSDSESDSSDEDNDELSSSSFCDFWRMARDGLSRLVGGAPRQDGSRSLAVAGTTPRGDGSLAALAWVTVFVELVLTAVGPETY